MQPSDQSASTSIDALMQAFASPFSGSPRAVKAVRVTGEGHLSSCFAVTDFAVAAMATAGLAVAERIALASGGSSPEINVDRRLASLWFGQSYRPIDWSPPPAWDAIAGDYRARDGWIRLHTNAPAHRAAALRVLDVEADRGLVAARVADVSATDLEARIVAEGGCAAAMHTASEWRESAQGRAVAAEPLVARITTERVARPARAVDPARPLAGIRVLDLTRVLAGPVATRLLAGYGADVLRIDPPDWDEPAILPDVTLGKRCARLDLKTAEGRARLEALLVEADMLVHGYRGDALERLGLGVESRHALRPGLVDVCLDAYGWTGDWALRRGFDSLVQMSTGIAEAGMRHYRTDAPKPLPVQALDHATGYILAAAAIHGLNARLTTGEGSRWRTSLARVAYVLLGAGVPEASDALGPAITATSDADFDGGRELTGWGAVERLQPPIAVAGAPLQWQRPAGPLGRDSASW